MRRQNKFKPATPHHSATATEKGPNERACDAADEAGNTHTHVNADLAFGHAQSKEQGGCLLRR